MLTRRSREAAEERSKPAPFAAKAKDLTALRDAVVDAAGVGTGLWLSYLFVLFYFSIAAGAVTHRDLLLENPVKLPFLNVELPLKAFFFLGPLVFLIVHAYVLLHFVLLAGKIGAFHSELQLQVSGDAARARLRRQLPSNIFVQSLAGPRDVRRGPIGFLLRLVIQISLVVGPIALLVLFQLQFLPYHSEGITNWQRIAVVIDLALLWVLWPPIVRGDGLLLGWQDFKRVKIWAWALVSVLPVLLVVTIATFPGEWLEERWPPFPVLPTKLRTERLAEKVPESTGPVGYFNAFASELNLKVVSALQPIEWATPHELLVVGTPNFVAQRPSSLFSNVLVLPNFAIGDRVKFDPEGKISIASDRVSLRGRDLRGAILFRAHLEKADFTGARLQRAYFFGADLREAEFGCDLIGLKQQCAQLQGAALAGAGLQGASLVNARLQGADLRYAELQGAALAGARLQGAFLDYAGMWGADLQGAQLQGASLEGAQLQGANFDNVELQGAYLVKAELLGVDLRGAQLQGARLDSAQLQGASLDFAQLQGASLSNAKLQGASLSNAKLQGASLNGAQLQGASLNSARLQGADLRLTQLQGVDLQGAQLQAADFDRAFVWRAKPPRDDAAKNVWGMPEPGAKSRGLGCKDFNTICDWTPASFAALKALIEKEVPAGPRRDAALTQIAVLEKPPDAADQAAATGWAALSHPQLTRVDYLAALATTLLENLCTVNSSPDAIAGMVGQLDFRFKDDANQEAKLADAFLNETKCPAARGLSEKTKARLREMRDRAPAPPAAGTASR